MQRRMLCLRGRARALGAVLGLLVLVAPGAGAEGGPGAPEGAVPLDRLLRVPTGTVGETRLERRGGHTKAEWESRFRAARAEKARAEREIELTRAAIEKRVAQEGGSQWRMAAPGLLNVQDGDEINASGETPVDFKLTQLLRRLRADLERADRRIQDLEVEANLAAVPADWRAPPDPEAEDS